MKPILFDKSATTFTTNGIGRLDCVSCVVVEERNGQYELTMKIAYDSQFADQIEMNSIIVVKPSVGASLQAFRVYDIEKPINGILEVYAQHISYELNYVTVMPFSVTASGTACQTALSGLRTNAVGTVADQYTFTTDVTVVAPYTQVVPQILRSCLGGIQGSILDQYGGEYEFNNYNVILHRNRGIQNPVVTLRYGKDITDISQEENIANTITGIVPFWVDSEGGNTVVLPEKVVESSHASEYPFKRTIPYDFSSAFQEAPTEAQLRAKAQAYINNANIGIPKVSIKVSFIDLSQTEEYKDLLSLQSVKLCDVINVYFEKLDITTTAEIVKTKYDCLLERYVNIEIGSTRTNLANTINDTSGAIYALANSTAVNFSKMSNELQEDIDNATAWLTSSGGYVVAVKNTDGSWKELLFLDHNDIAQAVNVLRINENGIGFSRNGVAGPYAQAWTIDGKLIIGGTNVPSITVYDSNNNIIFQASASGMIWNAANSTMSAAGVLTATGAILHDALIYGGAIQIFDESNYYTLFDSHGISFGKDQTQYALIYPNFDNDHKKLYFNGSDVLEISANDWIRIRALDYNNNLKAGVQFTSDGNSYFNSYGDFDINCRRLKISDIDSSTGYFGYNGNVVTGISTATAEYLEDVTPEVNSTSTIFNNMLWNVVMESDGHGGYTGALQSWTIGNVEIIDSVTVSLTKSSAQGEVVSNVYTQGVHKGFVTQ